MARGHHGRRTWSAAAEGRYDAVVGISAHQTRRKGRPQSARRKLDGPFLTDRFPRKCYRCPKKVTIRRKGSRYGTLISVTSNAFLIRRSSALLFSSTPPQLR